ncbi:MAG: hypothetical protein ACYC35_11315 [Pirellulales bacterium]
MKRTLLSVVAMAMLWLGDGWARADVAGAPGPYLAGDADRDGDVDIFDVARIQPHYGAAQGMTWATGDFDGDTDLDIFDIAMMQTNYGASTVYADPPRPIANPEPSAFVLWGGLISLGACAAWWRRRKAG